MTVIFIGDLLKLLNTIFERDDPFFFFFFGVL